MNNPLRLGLIGGGNNSAVGRTHFIAAQMDGLFQIQAGCFSRHSEINIETARKWNVSTDRVYPNWEALLCSEQGKLDAVVVLTPIPQHRTQVIAALNYGYSVICEKALAGSSSEAYDIEMAALRTGGFLAVTYNYTGYPMVRELRQMIRDGYLGRIEQIQIEMPQESYARLDSNGNPFVPQQWRMSDGFVPTISLDLGAHAHHLVQFLTEGKVREVVASQTSLGQFRNVVDNVMIIARYQNGMEGQFWYSKAALGHRNGLRIRVYGEQGAAEWFQMSPEEILCTNNRGRQERIDRASPDIKIAQLDRYNRFKSGHPAGFVEAFGNTYADIAHQINPDSLEKEKSIDFVFTAKDAREGLLFLEAVSQSASERRWVDLDLENKI